MTDPAQMDQAALDRIARLQQRRQGRPSAGVASPPPAEPLASEAAGARRPARRRRPHPAAGGRVLAAGLGATTMFGITAVLAIEATADTTTQPESSLSLPTVAPVTAAPPPVAVTSVPAERQIEGQLPPGFTLDDIDVDSIPEGGVLTGELTDDGRPVVVIFHAATEATATVPTPGSGGGGSPAAAPSAAATPAPAAPTALTATPVVTEVAVPAPAPTPAAPPATTSGS